MNQLHLTTAPMRCRLASAVLGVLLPMAGFAAPNVEFNTELLLGGGAMDLSRYQRGGALPGTYIADIRINDVIVGRRDITVSEDEQGLGQICWDPELFEVIGIDTERMAAAIAGQSSSDDYLALPEGRTCAALDAYVPSASASLDVGEQILDISVPQAYLARSPKGWVAPTSWDHGINAATLSYSANHSRQQSRGNSRSSTSVTLDAGVNLGAWRLRHSGYLSRGEQGTDYAASRSFVQRDLQSIGSQLKLGDAATDGDMFDGVSYRGVNISTDARMLPDSQRLYAPIVRGVAQTNARVVIRQRGYVVHESTVAPGPFEIDDLDGSGSSGDLEVEVIETDGRVERFTLPFTAMPQLLRQGQQRFSITAGQLRDPATGNAGFAEVTLRRGLGNQLTGFAGVTVADGYRAAVLGGALNTRFGSFSGDITLSDAWLPKATDVAAERRRGQSYRLAYNKSLFSSGTNITMAAYRYSTADFLSLSDAARLGQQREQGSDAFAPMRQRSRLDLTVSQKLGENGGNLFVNGSTADYWDHGKRQTNFSVGYSNRIGRASYSLTARRTLESSLFTSGPARQSNSIYLGVSMPLGVAPSAPRATANVSHDSDGRSSRRLGVSGMLGADAQGNYNASVSDQGNGTSFNAGLNYQLPVATVGASYGQSQGNRQLSLSASGGLVLHAEGMTLAQSLGETIGIVHVPGAEGAGVGNMDRVRTDRRGYAVAPHLNAYRRNEVNIDPAGLPLDIELSAGSVSAVPTAGAVVKMVLPTAIGRNALIEALMEDGTPLPFGADVFNEAGDVVGVVGQGSRLWVRGLEEQGVLSVRHAVDQQCSIPYDIRSVATDGLLESRCAATAANVAAVGTN
ncbi:fimbrial biogenesis outer membrane usher protein [Stenotrophomonas maltophilia]|uniref:Fimbrial biogenesis outer membrane usher protein n=1 Tax=Stenotrophomonas riyadhensis TaxID=2859893 RepID=A0ABT2XCR7_9GAMM|nr:fimbria/pilus outer membrane usher protein [Stenotrophomonas sp. CFS3442]MBH1619501.1 fimbrial biogenesis outer membrane usher protein [Stenotrophomonas maltophilia]MCV0323731.1 fimbrial biogenesis outer membrane usher protein [Stenotrophomonas sp. CFS3442]HEL4244670.1 fimbrial biogenesis outer membrane usher protein [Stenotrophomonas maltophilia]